VPNLIKDVPYNVMGIGANFNIWKKNNDNADASGFNWAAFDNVQKTPEYFGDLKKSEVGITVLDIGNNPAWWSGAGDVYIATTQINNHKLLMTFIR